MAVVTGVLGNLGPKLLQLLHDEYKLQKGVRAEVESLSRELDSMHIALCMVAQMPHDQLHPQVKHWACEVREASYDIEDVLDSFLVCVDGGHQSADADKAKVKRLLEKMGKLFNLSKVKARREIAGTIEDIKKQVEEMAKRRDRYLVHNHVASSATKTSIDPRVLTLHTKASELVGINEPTDALIKMLTLGDDDTSNKIMKTVSIVGSGGLGKTTLAKVVYEKLTMDLNIHCKAFVVVGQKPDLKKVFRDILLDLNKEYYMTKTNFMILDEGQLIGEIKNFLKEKRYFIVIDDVWDVSSWNAIRIALEDEIWEGKIIVTTRNNDVAKVVHWTYKMKALLPDSSKILFYKRIFGSEDKCPEIFSEISDRILKKCQGVPLAIITIASLLANKSDDIVEWQKVCSSIGLGLSSSNDMYNDMRAILSLSYDDLPPHMKTCFLYLSIYPEDYEINKDRLIWSWIAEGFIHPPENGDDRFEVGESYFNDLINRSLVQPVGSMDSVNGIYACRVHDMILDLIYSLSREENFVTISNDIEQVICSESKRLRRLSLRDTTWPKKGVSQVRSMVIFQTSFDSAPSLSCFNVLRVLDLAGCILSSHRGSKLCVSNLIHLRYLGLRGTCLMEGIEKLQFLQVLKISGNNKSPESIFGLRRLMCLEGVCCSPRSGNLLRNLTSLQVLYNLYVDKDSACALEELGHLTQLRKLVIQIKLQMDQSMCDALVESLCKLPRLQILSISHTKSSGNNLIKWERWAPPPCLLGLRMDEDFSLWTLPKWINPASLPHLTYLRLSMVHTVDTEDIQMLGALPNLMQLTLEANRGNFLESPLQKFSVSADAFQRATRCNFKNVLTVPSMFTPGAFPRVEVIHFCLRAKDFVSNGGLDFDDLAIKHIPSLRSVVFYVHGEADVGKEEVMKLEEALKLSADVHPNHPSISIRWSRHGPIMDCCIV